jgi:hypothetical protein
VRTLKPTFVACLALCLVTPPALAQTASLGAPPVAHKQFARYGGRFSGRGFGARGFGRRGLGYRTRRGHGIFRSIVRALAIGYLLHLLFTTPGGLFVLVLMALGVFLLTRRLRRGRVYRY